MPVTFTITQHPARAFKPTYREEILNDPKVVLKNLPTGHIPRRLLQSSVDGSQNIVVKKNGLVLGALTAYNMHHNLVIRYVAHRS